MSTVTVADVDAEFPSGSSGFASAFVQVRIDRAENLYGSTRAHANWGAIVRLQVAHWLYMLSAFGMGNIGGAAVAGPIKRAKLRDKEFEFAAGTDEVPAILGDPSLNKSPYGEQLIPLLMTLPGAVYGGYGRPPLLL